MYWPVALTEPSSLAVISTIAVFGEFSCGGSTVDTSGGAAITVTAGPGPGCHEELAAAVRYCRAIAWSSANSALARMKFCTICTGPQPGWGGLMICAQHGLPCCWPPTLAGSLVDCSGPLTGTSAQPATVASAASAASAATSQRSGGGRLAIARAGARRAVRLAWRRIRQPGWAG